MPLIGKIKVLIVDDEKVVRDFLTKLLTLKGVNIEAVDSGLKAIESAKKEKFDLALLDVRMPKLNGLETFRELKKIIPNAKYVMMTGYAVDDLLKEAEREGAALSIKKPFDIQQISSLLEEFVSRKSSAKKMSILVVDDDQVVLEFFKRLLSEHDVVVASNGEDALAKIKQKDFDLVFLDIVLKDTTARALYPRIQEIRPNLEIMLITGDSERAESLMQLDNIRGYLYKPFEIDKIFSAIEEVRSLK